MYLCTAACLRYIFLPSLYENRIKSDQLCISSLHHCSLVLWCFTGLPQATQAALSSGCGPGQTQDRRRGSNLWQLVPDFPLMSPTQLLSTPDKDPVFPAQRKDNPSIRILAKFCCWTKLMEQPGALGQDNGQQQYLYITDEVPLPLNQLMKEGCLVSQPLNTCFSFNFFQHQMYQELFNVGDLFIQKPVHFQKTRKEDQQRRRMVALP